MSVCTLPDRLREPGLLLLNQQCWHWGHDIRRAQSGEHPNALLDYGFTRRRPPEGQKAATMYSLTLPSGYVVTLWGFGIWFGDVYHTGIYLNRFRFEPQWVEGATLRAGVWAIEHLASARASATASERGQAYALMAAAAEWMGEYESWALEALGREHRQLCVDSYAGEATPAERMPDAWQSLAQVCRSEAAERLGSAPLLPPASTPPVVAAGRYLAECYRKRDSLQRWMGNAQRLEGKEVGV